jgi:hypothetical protein
MQKTIFKSIQAPLPTLKKIRKRVSSDREDTNSNRVMESKKMHVAFKSLCSQIPSRPANLIVLGHHKDGSTILDFIGSKGDLRQDFKSDKNDVTRWAWCLE